MENKNDELVSVVIPAFNREYIIKDCIESVLKQTYQNIEVIVVDDCSSDHTVDVVRAIKDPRVRCFQLSKNSGACHARNIGAEQAKGQYIAFQDSDDTWLPTKIEEQIEYLKQGNYDVVFCGMDRITLNQEHFYYPQAGFDENKDAFEQILLANRISTQCMLVKSYVLETVQFDPIIRKYQDWDYAIRVAQSFKIGYLPKALVISEIQADSISAVVSKYEALNVIYNKYTSEIIKYPYIQAMFFYRLAEESWSRKEKNLKEIRRLYYRSLKSQFNLKVLIKLIASLVGKQLYIRRR